MKTLRIALQESVLERDVDAAAWDQDWLLVKTIQATEDTPHEVIWQDSIENIEIHYWAVQSY